jgi:hypothetical protein
MRISQATVYRHIQQGKIETERNNGKLHIILNSDAILNQNENELVAQLRKENQFLQEELRKALETIQQMQQDAAYSQQRSDTIILQLTRQFEEQTKLLEDMRQQNEPKKSHLFRRLFFKEKK